MTILCLHECYCGFRAEYEVTDVKYYFPTSLAEIQDYEVPDFL